MSAGNVVSKFNFIRKAPFKVAVCLQNTADLAEFGRICRIWQSLADSADFGRIQQSFADSGRVWQSFADSGRLSHLEGGLFN